MNPRGIRQVGPYERRMAGKMESPYITHFTRKPRARENDTFVLRRAMFPFHCHLEDISRQGLCSHQVADQVWTEKGNNISIVEAGEASSKIPYTAHTFGHLQQMPPPSPQVMSIQQSCHVNNYDAHKGRIPELRRTRPDDSQNIRQQLECILQCCLRRRETAALALLNRLSHIVLEK